MLVRAIRRADATILSNYATLAQLQAQVAALQETMAQLTKTANTIGDMPLTNVTVKVINLDNKATVKFLGKNLTSGETTFKVPAYSQVFLSVVLSTFNVSNTYYTYTVKINGEYFDNLAYEYQKAGDKVYNSGEVAAFMPNSSFARTKLSDVKIGSAGKEDTYYNRSVYQNRNYIYVDVVDAIQDYECATNHRPNNRIDGTDTYFENRLLLGVTSAAHTNTVGDYTAVRIGASYTFVGLSSPKYYNFSTKEWTDPYNASGSVHQLGLTHSNNFDNDGYFFAPIYAKIPNFVYRNNLTTEKIYKVGTTLGTGWGREGLDANMYNQVIGPFNQANNTIEIEVTSYDVVN